MHTYQLSLPSFEHTLEFGQKIAKLFENTTSLILLSGDLGAGKTTFSQGFLKQLMPNQVITSPTYSYMNMYEALSPIFHFDLYRISSQEDLEELGLWEHLLDKRVMRLVEWPEHALGLEQYADMHLHFDIKKCSRDVRITYLKSIEALLDTCNIGC